ncbi:MAG: TetR/AcrR family transcriptional regulator [Ilumatobacteraceae bacterium]
MARADGEESPPARRGPGRPRNTDSEATKLRILDAAIDSFGAGGFANTSSQTIASAAGVTPATVYHHFVNKRQLYVAAFQHSVDIAWKGYDEVATATGGSLRDELIAVMTSAAGIMQRRPTMTMLAIRAAIDLDLAELDRTLIDAVVTGMARRAIARGELPVEAVVFVRPLVEMTLWGFSVVGVSGDVDWQHRCLETFDLVLHEGLLRKPTRRRRTG